MQHGIVKNSKHFDPTPLRTALEDYIRAYETNKYMISKIESKSLSWDERIGKQVVEAWSKVLSVLMDLPANWNQQEYSRATGLEDHRAHRWTWNSMFRVPEGPGGDHIKVDVKELVNLDKARTTDLKSSLVSLGTTTPRDETSLRL